jgi:hypothetical protein
MVLRGAEGRRHSTFDIGIWAVASSTAHGPMPSGTTTSIVHGVKRSGKGTASGLARAARCMSIAYANHRVAGIYWQSGGYLRIAIFQIQSSAHP